jgi:uncharacterized protein YggE
MEDDNTESVHRMSVVGTGAAVAQVDGAVLRLGLEVSAGTAGEALTELAERSDAVSPAGRAAGLTGAELQTQGLSLNPPLDGPTERVIAYRAAHNLSVTILVQTPASRSRRSGHTVYRPRRTG